MGSHFCREEFNVSCTVYLFYIFNLLFFSLDIDNFYFSLLTFLEELLNKDQSVVKAFTNNILRHVSHHSFFHYLFDFPISVSKQLYSVLQCNQQYDLGVS